VVVPASSRRTEGDFMMNHHNPEFFARNSVIWNPSVLESGGVYFNVKAAAFWLLPEPSHGEPPTRGIHLLGNDPWVFQSLPQSHWQSLTSDRGGNRHLALRQELKPDQLSFGQGEPRPALRLVLSSQSRVQDFSLGTAKIIFIGSAVPI